MPHFSELLNQQRAFTYLARGEASLLPLSSFFASCSTLFVQLLLLPQPLLLGLPWLHSWFFHRTCVLVRLACCVSFLHNPTPSHFTEAYPFARFAHASTVCGFRSAFRFARASATFVSIQTAPSGRSGEGCQSTRRIQKGKPES